MNISNKYPVMIFKSEYQGNKFYKVGLSKKDVDGNYINGYMPVRFKKGIELEDKTKIYIKNAWLDFYIKDKTTMPYIFISEFEKLEDTIENAKTEQKRTDQNNEVDLYEQFGSMIEHKGTITGEEIDNIDMQLPF